MRRRRNVLPALVIGLLLVFPLMGVVQAQLPNFQLFYGTVTHTDGTPAPVGTVVRAEVDGPGEVASITLTAEMAAQLGPGVYGGINAGDEKLAVQGAGINNGDTIRFFVNDVEVDQEPFQNQAITELNLVGSFASPAITAEMSLPLHQDPEDGVSGLKVEITRVFDPDNGNDVNVDLEAFRARFTYLDPSANPAFPTGTLCVNILDVRNIDFPITGRNIDNASGIATFVGSDATGVSWPVDLGHALTRLTGGANQQCQVDLALTSLSDVDENPIAIPTVLSHLLQRGDARADGNVTIADALFIAQYLVGSREACTDAVDTTCLHSVNAASVRQDGASDRKTIADALFIAQYLVGVRDEFYNLVP